MATICPECSLCGRTALAEQLAALTAALQLPPDSPPVAVIAAARAGVSAGEAWVWLTAAPAELRYVGQVRDGTHVVCWHVQFYDPRMPDGGIHDTPLAAVLAARDAGRQG